MEFLQEMLMQDQITKFAAALESLQKTHTILVENYGPGEYRPTNVKDMPQSLGLPDMFAEALKRLAAAEKGLSLANRLKTPDGRPDQKARSENRSRVMGNLNRIRGLLAQITRAVENEAHANQAQMASRPYSNTQNQFPTGR